MRGFVESLNISVCAAISLFTLRNKCSDLGLDVGQKMDLLNEWAVKNSRIK